MRRGNDVAWLSAILRIHRHSVYGHNLELLRSSVEDLFYVQNRV